MAETIDQPIWRGEPPACNSRSAASPCCSGRCWRCLTTAAQPVPPFQLMALTFGVAFLLAMGKWIVARLGGGPPVLSHLRQPAKVWALGVAGLFGYHFFYFTALGHAPPADASLIAFLWPLLIVLLSALLPGERLRWWHLAGGLAGLVGAGLLVTRGGGMALRPEFMPRLSRRTRLRLHLVDLLGDQPPVRRGAERCRRRLLRRHGAARVDVALPVRADPDGRMHRAGWR